MGKLAASILAADLAHLADQVKLVSDHAEVIHIDMMDGHLVPAIALGTVVVASLRSTTDLPLHGHLMVDAPEAYFDELAEAGLDIVSFHREAVSEPGPSIVQARAAGLGVGLTIDLDTPVETFVPYLEQVDDVMLMSIRPGWSGQTLDPVVYPRPEAARDQIDRCGLVVELEIDGSVKVDNALRAVEAGATILGAATEIFRAAHPTDAARRIAEIAGAAA